jgi:replicative DNA helicase
MSAQIAPEMSLYAQDAECAVLGGILRNTQLMAEAIAALRPQDFSGPRERLIYSRMIELWEAGSAIDELTIRHSMNQPGELQKAGGVAFLSDLADSVKRSTLEPYIAIVRQRARRRELTRLCEVTQHRASDLTRPLAESVESLREGVLEIESNNTKLIPQHVAQFTDQAINEWEGLQNQPTDLAGLTRASEPSTERRQELGRGSFGSWEELRVKANPQSLSRRHWRTRGGTFRLRSSHWR